MPVDGYVSVNTLFLLVMIGWSVFAPIAFFVVGWRTHVDV